jgi:hypothetical protein
MIRALGGFFAENPFVFIYSREIIKLIKKN